MVNVYELTLGCKILRNNTEIEVNKIEVDKINNIPIEELHGIEINETTLKELGFNKGRDEILPELLSYKMTYLDYHITVTKDLSNTPGKNYNIHIDSPDFSTSGTCIDVQYIHQIQSIINFTITKG